MIRRLLVFVLLLVGWWAVLWLRIAPDFTLLSIERLAAVHFAPPIAVCALWLLGRRIWRQRREAAVAARKAAADAERQARRDEARRQHDVERQRLAYGCDCRALALTQLVASAAADLEALAPAGEAVSVSRAEDGADEAGDALLDHLMPGIEEALQAIYERCPAAALVPVYVAPPPDSLGVAVVAGVREIRAAFLAASHLPESAAEFDRVLYLPAAGSAADSAIGLFETIHDLPAAVVLAFDSPFWRGQSAAGDADAQAAAQAARGQGLGEPGQAVVALFLTHPRLAAMLTTLAGWHGKPDAMTPHWDRQPAIAAHDTPLAQLPEDARDALRDLPPLARIHRAALTRLGSAPQRPGELARGCEALIERAQIHAALIDLPFTPPEGEKANDAAGNAPSATPPPAAGPADCGWLVHNADERSGKRLAALGDALHARGLKLDPVAEATHLAASAGNLGQARGVAMLAMTVAHAASRGNSALCAEFQGADGLAVYFAVAAPDSGNLG